VVIESYNNIYIIYDVIFQVTYRNAFEPYVVVRMESAPRFNELMLERFADKALYARTLHAVGYSCNIIITTIMYLSSFTEEQATPLNLVEKLYGLGAML